MKEIKVAIDKTAALLADAGDRTKGAVDKGQQMLADINSFAAAHARKSIDAPVAETARGTEAMLKFVGEVAQPIVNRVALAADATETAA